MKKNAKKIIGFVLCAVILVLLLNPGWFPFLPEGLRNAIGAELQAVFGPLAGGEAVGLFSPARLIPAAAVLIFMWLITTALCFLLEKVSAGKRRSQTVAGLISSVVKVVGGIVALVWVLSVLGVNLAAIFASLGVVSLILGFGVQSLIEDCVTGIFLILENQYNIGDIVVLEDFRGTVRRISMRTTVIEDAGGNLKIVNNSDIRNIQNRSRATSVAIAEVGISYHADLAAVEEILAAELPRLQQEDPQLFLAAPVYMGVQALADSAVVLRVTAEVKEENIFVAQRRLNRELKLIMDKHGVEIPFPQVVVHREK